MSIKSLTKKITAGIIKALESGTIPWKSGMSGLTGPTNYDEKPYRGMNRWILAASVLNNNFPTNTWITYHRCQKEEGHVLKGSKSTTVVLWKFKKYPDRKCKECGGKNKNCECVRTIPMLRTFNVFNLAQTSLYDPKKVVVEEKVEKDVKVDVAEQLIGTWNNEVEIKYGFNNLATPYYSPGQDYINIPFGDGVEWNTDEWMHKTTFHEMLHSTGHKSRLDRFDKAVLDNVGDAGQLHSKGQYSAEELVAEFGSQILADYCGFKEDLSENTAAYIQSWIKCLKNNPDWVMWAASRAEKGVDMILKQSE